MLSFKFLNEFDKVCPKTHNCNLLFLIFMFIAHFTIRLLLTLLLLMLQIMLQADYKYNDLMYAPKNNNFEIGLF